MFISNCGNPIAVNVSRILLDDPKKLEYDFRYRYVENQSYVTHKYEEVHEKAWI